MSRLADLPVATTQLVEASPHRMSDDAKVAFADNSILLGRRNGIEPEITEQPVEVALHPVPGWLQAGGLQESTLSACHRARWVWQGYPLFLVPEKSPPLLPPRTSRPRLRQFHQRGTIERGFLCFAVLYYAVLCYVYQGT